MELGKNQGFGKNLYVFGKIKSFLGKLPKIKNLGNRLYFWEIQRFGDDTK